MPQEPGIESHIMSIRKGRNISIAACENLKAAKPLIKQKYSVVFLYSWRNFWAWCIGFSSSLRRRSCTCICALRFGIRHFRCNTLHKQPPHTKDGKCMDIKLYTYTYIHIHTYIHTYTYNYIPTYIYICTHICCLYFRSHDCISCYCVRQRPLYGPPLQPTNNSNTTHPPTITASFQYLPIMCQCELAVRVANRSALPLLCFPLCACTAPQHTTSRRGDTNG